MYHEIQLPNQSGACLGSSRVGYALEQGGARVMQAAQSQNMKLIISAMLGLLHKFGIKAA